MPLRPASKAADAFVAALMARHELAPAATRDLTSSAECVLSLRVADELLAKDDEAEAARVKKADADAEAADEKAHLTLDEIAVSIYAQAADDDDDPSKKRPANLIQACKEAESKKRLRACTHTQPCHLSVIFPMYHETKRLQPRSERNPNGQDLLRNKIRQLEWLASGLDAAAFSYDVLACDDGCDEGSSQLVRDAAAASPEVYGDRVRVVSIQDAIDRRLPVFTPALKTPADSRKGGAVLYGMHVAATEPHRLVTDKKLHLVMFTDADMSASLAMAGLLIDKMVARPQTEVDNAVPSRGADIASGARYGYDASYLVTESGATGHPASHYAQPNVVHITVRHFLRSVLLPDIAHLFDTNVGYKAWRAADVPALLKTMTIFGPAFDMQLLLNAMRFYKKRYMDAGGVAGEFDARSVVGVAPILFVEDFAESNFTSNVSDPDASAKGFLRMAHEIAAMHKHERELDAAEDANGASPSTPVQRAWLEFIASLDLKRYKAMIAGLESDRGRHLPFEEQFTVEQMQRYITGEAATKL